MSSMKVEKIGNKCIVNIYNNNMYKCIIIFLVWYLSIALGIKIRNIKINYIFNIE